MTKRLFAVFVMVALLSPLAGAKKEKTITYKDSTLTDPKYGYSMNVSDNWKVKGLNEPNTERVFLEKKNGILRFMHLEKTDGIVWVRQAKRV